MFPQRHWIAGGRRDFLSSLAVATKALSYGQVGSLSLSLINWTDDIIIIIYTMCGELRFLKSNATHKGLMTSRLTQKTNKQLDNRLGKIFILEERRTQRPQEKKFKYRDVRTWKWSAIQSMDWLFIFIHINGEI